MVKQFIKICQGELNMFLISLNANELIENTIVELYDSSTKDGYQRPLIPSHYRKIARYLRDSQEPILAPSILTAIDSEKIKIDDNTIEIKSKLRVVDGQHRIQGLRYCHDNDHDTFRKIQAYEFPVIILLVVNNDDRIHEITTFVDINSKGKKVPTDLAIELREKLRRSNINTYFDKSKEFIESISINICEKIDRSDVWYNSIKRGDEPGRIKPISISAFSNSLHPIIEVYVKYNEPNADEIIDVLVGYVDSGWKVVAMKWHQCFDQKYGKFNLQKGIGVFPIHIIMSETLDSSKGDIEYGLAEFKKILDSSNTTFNDWKQGGKFSSFNSKTGFNQIVKYIKNEESYISQKIN